ncbi:glycerophosphodiester phosphodiesterase family protein [Nonomuraea sp. NPDC050310]|uniref:glycerophosphodiester phosphodiesterase family protein n=1 Tax=Nonomuraea sp. NPDC050310 TaxID=3154935 RepID=UPI0033D90116
MIVIAHRGASALRPEHTLLSYECAIVLGADYIEPDLVATRDHVLVARHENEISGTTDVAARPEFADRRATKEIDGRPVTGWFTEDFTLAELKTLRACERVPELRPANTAFDGLAEIPTFDEVLALARRHGVGVYPETKHPSHFAALGLPLEDLMLERLAATPVPRVFLQSFEVGNLRELRGKTSLPLIQLMYAGGRPYDWVVSGEETRGYDELLTPEGLREVATYADGIGVHTGCVVRDGEPTTLVRDAHEAGLQVHVWTIRNENSQLPPEHRLGDPASPAYERATGDVAGWLGRLLDLGIDGAFCDDPGLASAVLRRRSA